MLLIINSWNFLISGKDNGTGNLSGDMTTWLSGALGNQDTCIDGFEGTNSFVKTLVGGSLDQVTSLVRDILGMVRPGSGAKSNSGSKESGSSAGRTGPSRRKLLKNSDFPRWLKRSDRKLLQASGNGNGTSGGSGLAAAADAVVAADGSGNFTSVMDAIAAAPDYSLRRFVIYVKKGVYKEYVEISKKKLNVMLIGDGMDVTIISGNRNFIDGWTTYRSATFGKLLNKMTLFS